MKKLLFALFTISLIFASCKSTKQEEPVEEPAVEQPAEETQEEPAAEPESQPEPEAVSYSDKNSKLMAKVDEARSDAINAGAKDLYADQMSALEEKYNALKNKTADSNEDLSAELDDLNYRYLALAKASETRKLRSKIEENGFDQDNKAAYDAAGKLLEDLEKLISENADGKTAYKTADAAYLAHYTIYYNEFKKLADKERKAALEQKHNADNVKAGVSRKDAYKAITETFKKGDSAYVTKHPDVAYDCYKESKEKYEALYNDISEKRAAAQKRIDEAKAKVQDVENFAAEADQTAPIGDEKINGIEEKDAVLLDKDEFASPDSAVIEVDESVKVENDSTVDLIKDAIKAEGDR